MKILAFIDFHLQFDLLPILEKKAKECDIIICGGDPSIFEQGLYESVASFTLFGKPILMIHGNHEMSSSMREVCEELADVDFFHKEKRVIEDISFFGWGGGGFSMFNHKLDDQVKAWKKQLGKKNVLVTHAPPYKTKLDDLGHHVGSKSIRKAIEVLKPNFAICGHIHETAGMQDKIGKTIIINPGPEGKIIEL